MKINSLERILLFFIPVILCLITFSQIRGVGFAYVDDEWMLLENALVPKGFNKNIFLDINNLQYSPLNTLYYILIYKIDNFNPYWYHLGSLIIHLLNGYLVFKLLETLFSYTSIIDSAIAAYFVMLIWLVHPFNVESVVWISASKIPLYTFFFLLSFYTFIIAYKKKQMFSWYYVISVFCYIFSFLFKEQSIILLAVLTLYIVIDNKLRLVSFSYAQLKCLFPYFILTIIFTFITLYALHYQGASHPFEKFSVDKRIFFTFYSIGFYLFNTILPINLHYHYPYPIKSSENIPVIFIVITLLLIYCLISIILILKKKANYNIYLFFFLFFLLNLSLCLHILPLPRASIVADRYMYIPILGVLSIMTIYFSDWLKINIENNSKRHIIFVTVLSVIVVGFTIYSNVLVSDWFLRELNN
ncbi:hypothetical protein I6I98_08735 [Sphingobacterium multivorum]|uniref:Glycosyltransferase RgtA/B/C/D-like domain-containing protein n=1 Tax=Sphingobacterium multivorum TaxID=28454 RepID=A0ABX7CT84_SPHMU|nr:hypothetical protein [Sphingobacterium multivorum]QQT55323.1 hypothetical protein I6I98_08735 [Sphingobacterium multivorum]